MKKNVFIKWLSNLCALSVFGVVGTLAMDAPSAAVEETESHAQIKAEVVMPPDELLVTHGNGIKTFKDVNSYFAWVDSQELPRVMIVGNGRIVDGASKIYGSDKTYNFFLVCLGQEFYPDRVCDITSETQVKDLQYGQWDYVVFEGVGGSVFHRSKAFDLLKCGGKMSSDFFYGPSTLHDNSCFVGVSERRDEILRAVENICKKEDFVRVEEHSIRGYYYYYFTDAVIDSPLWDDYLKACLGLSIKDVDTEFFKAGELSGTNLFPMQLIRFSIRNYSQVLVLTKK